MICACRKDAPISYDMGVSLFSAAWTSAPQGSLSRAEKVQGSRERITDVGGAVLVLSQTYQIVPGQRNWLRRYLEGAKPLVFGSTFDRPKMHSKSGRAERKIRDHKSPAKSPSDLLRPQLEGMALRRLCRQVFVHPLRRPAEQVGGGRLFPFAASQGVANPPPLETFKMFIQFH